MFVFFFSEILFLTKMQANLRNDRGFIINEGRAKPVELMLKVNNILFL